MKQPGPDHPIEISPFAGRVRVRFGGHLVAEFAETEFPYEGGVSCLTLAADGK